MPAWLAQGRSTAKSRHCSVAGLEKIFPKPPGERPIFPALAAASDEYCCRIK